MKLSEIAKLIGGTLCGEDCEIEGVASLGTATAGQISFLANTRYRQGALQTKAGALILKEELAALQCPMVLCPNPYLAFARVLSHFHPPLKAEPRIHPTAVIEDGVTLAENVSIGANVYVGSGCRLAENVELHPNVVLAQNVCVGAGSKLYPNVTVYHGVSIGSNVILHSGVVVGADGFGYAPDGSGYFKIPQVGTVVIEDNVEVGANSTIDRATLGKTIVGQGTKIDNLVMVAHNVEIGHDTILVAQMGIAGSTVMGKHCTVGGQTAIAGHLTLGDNVMVSGRAGVTKNVEAGQVVSGYPAVPMMEEKRKLASLAMLPKTMKKIKEMEKQLTELKEKILSLENEVQK